MKAGAAGDPRPTGHTRLMVFAVLLAAALWVVFVNSFNHHELLLGAISVVATTVFVYSVARTFRIPMELRLSDLAQALRIPWCIVDGLFEVTMVLIKDLLHIKRADNLFRVDGFDSSRHDPLRIARTVLAVSFTTVSPNFIVIGIDPDQSRMLFHQISRSDVLQLTKNLGAKG